MSFSAAWLALREPIDHAARDEGIMSLVADLLSNKDCPQITDIGSGTGSTIRALRPILNDRVCWHLVDNDVDLLAVAKAEAADGAVVTSLSDLSTSLDAVFARPADLVTTSAFLDLVSEDWLEGFVGAVVESGIPFYAGLTYDGRAGCLPPLASDEIVLAAFNAHQKTDKGFGTALGPHAAHSAITLFEKAGYSVTSALSDWQAGPENAEFQKMLLDGWRGAASEIRPDLKSEFDLWFADRLHLIEQGGNSGASVFVGHVDFLAMPSL